MSVLPPPTKIKAAGKGNSDCSSSDFIEGDLTLHTGDSATIIPLPLGESTTSLTYRVYIDGKMLFLKRLKPQYLNNESYRSIFKKEYEVGCGLSHPNIVKYEALYDNEDACYLLMEHIQGETLNERITTQPKFFARRANLDKFVSQLLDSVHYLHCNNVLHGDLKPQNIMLTQINNDVKIIDLGFCLSNSYTDTAGMTREYAAPEQLQGLTQQMDHTTDIYAIGKMLEYIDQRTRHGVPYIYKCIMKQCLRNDRSKRYNSVSEIEHILQRKWWKMKRVWLTVCALIVGMAMWINHSEAETEQLPYDTEHYGIRYKITSKEDKTCQTESHNSNNIRDIVIHDKVTIDGKEYRTVSIADSCFLRDTTAQSLHLPDGIEVIGHKAFGDCKNISLLSIPNSVRKIGREAFIGMDNVTHLNISCNIDTISERAFACMYKLEKLTIPEGVKVLKLDAFTGCWSLKKVTLPSTLKVMERGIFYECRALKEIKIPASVEFIGNYCLYHCDSLTDIYNYRPTPQPPMPIVEFPSKVTLHVPAGSAELYREADYWNEMNIVEMEE